MARSKDDLAATAWGDRKYRDAVRQGIFAWQVVKTEDARPLENSWL
jgi:hypothetical protein